MRQIPGDRRQLPLFIASTINNIRAKPGIQIFTLAIVFEFALVTSVILGSITPFFYLRLITGFVSIAVLPGLLFLYVLDFDINSFESFLYSVGCSIIIVMILTALLNAVYAAANGFPRPMQEEVLVPAIVVVNLGLATLGRVLGRSPSMPSISTIASYVSPISLLLLLLPILAATGAILVRKSVTNVILLVLFPILLVALFALVWGGKSKYYSLSAWSLGVSLLLQNRLSLPGNPVGRIEFYHANLIMTHGFWNVNFATNKNSLLKLVLYHPSSATILDIPLQTEFRVVEALLLSTVPVALYIISSKQLAKSDALLATAVYIFPFTYWFRIIDISRTGSAIIFMSLFMLSLYDGSLSQQASTVLKSLFFFGIVISHYGVAVFFLGMLFVVYFSKILESIILNHHIPNRDYPGQTDGEINTILIVIFSIITVCWYMYTSSGFTFSLLVSVVYFDVISAISGFFSTESGSVQAISETELSLTYKIIRIHFAIILMMSSLGLGLKFLSRYRPVLSLGSATTIDRSPFNHIPLFFGIAAVGLLGSTFAPTDIIGPARMIAITLFFLAPFVVLGVRTAYAKVNSSGLLPSDYKTIFAAFLCTILLVQSGFLGATVTHGKSPQPQLDAQHILTDGTDEEIAHFFAVHTPTKSITATQWVLRYANTGANVSAVNGGLDSHFITTEFDTENPPLPNHINKGYGWNSNYIVVKPGVHRHPPTKPSASMKIYDSSNIFILHKE